MDNQEFYDKSVAHLRKQRRKALLVTTCAYRTDDGLACAVGGVMPDDLAANVVTTGNNTTSINDLLVENRAVAAFFRGVDTRLIENMQRVHDREEISDWEREFRWVARSFKLTYTRP
jgi:hypothetical protein